MSITGVPDHLRQIVRKKEAVLLAGTGVSISATMGDSHASWKGLLESGIDRCRDFGQPKLKDDDVEHMTKALESNDIDNWLSVATLIERKLKYPLSREWAKWLKDTVGSLSLKSTNLIEAMLGLELPIVTTNYDNLFSQRPLSRRLNPIDWKSGIFDEYFLSSPLDYVFHLHGSILNPQSVVLGISSYSEVLNDRFVQNFTRLLSLYKGFIFVGYGGGFDDPNFSQLVEFIGAYGSLHRHYLLVRECDLNNYGDLANLYPISYGETYEDLPNFLRSLPYGKERQLYGYRKGYSELAKNLECIKDMPYCPEVVVLANSTGAATAGGPDIGSTVAFGRTPVTVREWDTFCSERGSGYRKFIGSATNDNSPIVGVTYGDALEYCAWLSEITGCQYRLPTEKEWEYCALSGSKDAYWWGSDPNPAYANYRKSNIGEVTDVQSYPPNEFGLYDTHGNIWEWCSDTVVKKGYEGSSVERVLKGGCFYYDESYMAPKNRITIEEDAVFNSVGLRVVREMGSTVQPNSHVFIISLMGFYAIGGDDEENTATVSHFVMGKNQQWELVQQTGGLFHIIHLNSGRFLSAPEKRYDYEMFTLRPNAEPSQSLWQIERTYGGYVVSLHNSSLALDIEGGRKSSMAKLIAFEKHCNFNQVWNFILSSDSTPS